jgi:hypothetical protein
MPLLRGQVFHVTSTEALESIQRAGSIISNQDGRFGFTFPQSKNSYGRERGYVCLFDLRGASEEAVSDARTKFNFLHPTAADPAFLFVQEAHHPSLVPWTEAPTGAMLVPYVEAWYPGHIPVSALSHALAVVVEDDDIDSAYRGAMRRLRQDAADLLDSGLVIIQGRTMGELRERVEAWAQVARDAGLTVEPDWDDSRVEVTPDGFGVGVSASRREYWENLQK